jgi:Putative binding domain, N-terminal
VLVPGMAQTAQAVAVTLEWDANSESNLAGYKVYYGFLSRSYSVSIDVGKTTSHTVTGLQVGVPYYFAATAYDTSYQESGYSNEVSTTIPSPCAYVISPTSQSYGASGGNGSVSVNTPGGCAWTVSSSIPWVTITSNRGGSGNGVVTFSVAVNTGSARVAVITIAGQILTVNQSASTAAFTVTASAGTGGSISPSGAVSVRAGASQTFTITPSSRYRISSVIVDGVSKGTVSRFTFSNVNANHAIRATFRRR